MWSDSRAAWAVPMLVSPIAGETRQEGKLGWRGKRRTTSWNQPAYLTYVHQLLRGSAEAIFGAYWRGEKVASTARAVPRMPPIEIGGERCVRWRRRSLTSCWSSFGRSARWSTWSWGGTGRGGPPPSGAGGGGGGGESSPPG